MVDVPTREDMSAAIAAAIAPLDARIAELEQGEVVEAKSGTTKDVNAAVAKAPLGAVVRIPEGEFAFRGTVNDDRGIPILGAGRDRTRLVDKNVGRSQWGSPLFLHLGKTAKISGMTITGMGPINRATVTYSPESCELHASDMMIEHFGGAGFTLRNQVDAALITDIEWRELFTIEGADKHRNMGYGVSIYGDPSTFDQPRDALPLVVIDNCESHNVRHTVASNNAGRYRLQDSLLTNTENMNGAPVDTHADASWPTSGRYAEIVGNKIVNEFWYGILLRGREARVWNNDLTECGRGGAVGIGYDGGQAGVDSKFAPHDVFVYDNKPNVVEFRNDVPRDRVTLGPPPD